jgi:coenzyme F420 hydrogenase subunit beta
MSRKAQSIEEVVGSGLCIGCGLCEAVTGGRVKMKMTDYGSLRPTPINSFSPDEESQLLAACPGVTVEPRIEPGLKSDLVWGAYSDMRYAWAGNPDIRFRAATGGVLTALGVHLLRSKKASFILHTEVDPKQPMRSRWVFSESPEQVIASSGSRYGPAAPLAGLLKALDRDQPFAIIAKPCDLNAVHRFSKIDSRLDELCVARLVMVCGGQSRLAKSQALLEEFKIEEKDLTLFRYRGYGNPGLARIETSDGRAFEKTYLELWEDETGWQLETRCKLCPDALGEAADVAAADVWPGGAPTGEDAGFNGIIVRSASGKALVNAATEAGDLVLGDTITGQQLNDFQPHQVRKKEALLARFEGLIQAGLPAMETSGLRLEELGQRLDKQARQNQIEGTAKRVKEGRVTEPTELKQP